MLDIYQAVTDRIIAAIEAGTPPWVKPWSIVAEPLPVNGISHKGYRGINLVLLAHEAASRGYERNTWMTYRQATELGAHVRAGEQGAQICFFKMRTLESEETPVGAAEVDPPRVVPLLRAYTVFNLEQIDGLPATYLARPPEPLWAPHDAAEELIQASGVRVAHGGIAAFYAPVEDYIQIPHPGHFDDRGAYYATALHELTHATGHKSRLARELSTRFGEAAYAMEELVAEMGSAFLSAHCRLDGRLQHASYLEHWLHVLRTDKRAIFAASSKAQAAADYLLARLPEESIETFAEEAA